MSDTIVIETRFQVALFDFFSDRFGCDCVRRDEALSFGSVMPTETAAHIRLDNRGVAWIDQTNVKVIEVVLGKLAHGWSPEEIHFQHPHLSLAQIHAALTYYYDHQAELDARIEESIRTYRELRAQNMDSPLRKRLRELGKLQ